jgi:hypothetical protein
MGATLGADGLLPQGADREIYECAIDALAEEGVLSILAVGKLALCGMQEHSPLR